jgi:hypothetical protein
MFVTEFGIVTVLILLKEPKIPFGIFVTLLPMFRVVTLEPGSVKLPFVQFIALKLIVVKAVHPENAYCGIFVTFSPIVNVVTDVQLPKTGLSEDPIVVQLAAL